MAAIYIYGCTGNRYETAVPGATQPALPGMQPVITPPREYGTCQQGQGAWLLYEEGTVSLEMIQLALAAVCCICVALGWMSGSQR